MYIVTLKYEKSIEEVNPQMEPHIAFLKKNFALGKIITFGPLASKLGGVMLCNVGSEEELKELMQEDPFIIYNLVSSEIIDFKPVVFAPFSVEK